MGFIILDEYKSDLGIKLQNVFVTFQGRASLSRRLNRDNERESFCEGFYSIYCSKELYQIGGRALKSEIPFRILNLSRTQTESGLLKDLLYPGLKSELGFTNYVDDL